MKNLIWVLAACTIGSVVGVTASIPRRGAAGTKAAAGPPEARPGAAAIAPLADAGANLVSHRIVESEDYDLAGRRRKSIKVVLRSTHADTHRIWDTLREIATAQGADAVYVYAYWPGDNYDGPYTAGRLEWVRDGRGWASTATVPPEGKFDPGEMRPDPKSDEESRRHDRKICGDFEERVRNPFMAKIAELGKRLKAAQEKGDQAALVSELKMIELDLALLERDYRHESADTMKKLYNAEIRDAFKAGSDLIDRAVEKAFANLPFAKGFRDLDRTTERMKMPYDVLPD